MASFNTHWNRDRGHPAALFVALLHASGAMRIPAVQRLDDVLYDARLRATMPRTMDTRIVIVDIDEKSLSELPKRTRAPASRSSAHWPKVS
jgi:adenylate cyclase